MKNIRIYFGLAIFAFIVCLPQTSSAYETTEQTATVLNENTILYTITYRFGFLNREVYMPIGAVRGLENGSSSPYVGFDILNNGTSTLEGKVGALVLSKAGIKNNQYFLPEGKVADFTLVAIVTLPNTDTDNSKNVSLKMNHLPFIMVRDGEPGRTYLNEREMLPYVTPVAR